MMKNKGEKAVIVTMCRILLSVCHENTLEPLNLFIIFFLFELIGQKIIDDMEFVRTNPIFGLVYEAYNMYIYVMYSMCVYNVCVIIFSSSSSSVRLCCFHLILLVLPSLYGCMVFFYSIQSNCYCVYATAHNSCVFPSKQKHYRKYKCVYSG